VEKGTKNTTPRGYESEVDTPFYENTGTASSASWNLANSDYANVDAGNWDTVIDFADIDADGDKDLFVGSGYDKVVYYYRNDGNCQLPIWTHVTDDFLGEGYRSGWFSFPEFADMDADGDLDLFLGCDHRIAYYRNDGTANVPDFVLVTEDYAPFEAGWIPDLDVVDIDSDGDLDVFLWPTPSSLDDQPYFYLNSGTASNPAWTEVPLAANTIPTLQWAGQPFFENDGVNPQVGTANTIHYASSNSVSAGHVSDQSPVPGTTVPAGTPVFLTISTGTSSR